MKKENVLKILACSCFILPGNIKSPKRWFLSPLSLLSLITIFLVAISTMTELIGYQLFNRNDTMGKAMTTLKHVPPPPIGFCLRSRSTNATLIDVEGKEKISKNHLPPNDSKTATKSSSRPSHPHPMSELEHIVNNASRILIFVTNIVIRIFIWFSFSNLVDLLAKVFQPPQKEQQQQQDDDEDPTNNMGNGSMFLVWYEASQRWSTGEKVFLSIIAVSQFQRELEFFAKFYMAITKTGIDMLVIPCLIFQVVLEQCKALLSKELVSEIVAFFLVVIMKTLTNVIGVIAGKSGEETRDDDDNDEIVVQENSFFLGEIGGRKQFVGGGNGKLDKQAKASDMLFVKTRAYLLKGKDMNNKVGTVDGGIATIDEHISGIIGRGDNPVGIRERASVSENLFKTTTRLDGFYGNSSSIAPVDVIYSQINFIISRYFDLMAIWEQAQRFTGFVTLILFCELTTTFCLNTYMTLDNAMDFGLVSELGVSGIMRGVVIITKFICLCNAAQDLRDMTPVLLDQLLKLKLQLLSVPIEHYRKRDKSSADDSTEASSRLPSQCERCRGLGSFLSEMVSYIRAHPFELSALGYFTVSRSTLTTITGVIVTYLVVLVQFQSYASSSSSK